MLDSAASPVVVPRRLVQRWSFFATLSLAVVVLDQLSKWWAVLTLSDACHETAASGTLAQKLQCFLEGRHLYSRTTLSVIDSCFHFRYVENPGAAWGFLSATHGMWRTPFFLLLSLSAMAFILYYLRRLEGPQQLLRIGLTLVFGGAFGNFIDRARLGYVVDFIDWHAGELYTWPTFNLADAAISIGVGLLLLDTILVGRRGE